MRKLYLTIFLFFSVSILPVAMGDWDVGDDLRVLRQSVERRRAGGHQDSRRTAALVEEAALRHVHPLGADLPEGHRAQLDTRA